MPKVEVNIDKPVNCIDCYDIHGGRSVGYRMKNGQREQCERCIGTGKVIVSHQFVSLGNLRIIRNFRKP